MYRPCTKVTATALLTLTSSASLSVAQNWSFARVADSNTPVPGGGTFVGLGNRPFDKPSLGADGKVAFWARYNEGAGEGVYSNATGVLETVVNRTTLVPGSAQPFLFISPNVSYDTGAPTFSGQGTSAGGVYTRQGGQLLAVVDAQTPLPGGGGTFGITGLRARSGNRVVFGASSGLYLNTAGVNSLIADTTTPAPGGGTFSTLGNGSLTASTFAFGGSAGTRSGVFVANLTTPPTFSLVADTTTPIPNGPGVFRTIGTVSASEDNIAFVGSDDFLRTGVYARLNGQLLNIADTLHPGPGGIQFTGFGDVSISGDMIAFTAGTTTAPVGSLFVLRQGVLSRVVSVGDTLNGLSVVSIYIGPESLKGDTVAFSFTEIPIGPVPLRGGIYTATYIPAPAAVGLGAAAALWAARRQRPSIATTP